MCAWTVRSDFDWLEIEDPATGLYVHGIELTVTGSTTIKVHALSNAGAKRNGYFSIGGQKYAATQEGAAASDPTMGTAL